jgi:hypothetical protein
MVPMGVWASLIGEREAVAIAAIARAIPDLGDVFGFECRLRGEQAAVDLGICVRRRRSGTAFAVGRPLQSRDDAWARLGEFLAAWSDQGSTLDAWIPFVFLEFDAAVHHPTLPIPSVFVSLDEPLAEPSEARARGLSVVSEALHILHGRALDPLVGQTLGACFHHLPPAGRVVHVGAMLGREPATVRLSVAIPRDEVHAYFSSLGWLAPVGVVERVLAIYAPEGFDVHLEFDVAGTLGPTLGVVLAPGNPTGWDQLLGALVTHELCAPAKRDALLAWPGEIASTIAGAPYLVRRALSHVKISAVSGVGLEAKAYFTGSPCSVGGYEASASSPTRFRTPASPAP